MVCLKDSFMTLRDGLDCSSSILARDCDKHADFQLPLNSSGNTMSAEIFGQWKGAGFSSRYQAFDLSNGDKNTVQYNTLFILNSYYLRETS